MFRIEYPRPNFKREEWLSLNGKWNFSFDDGKIGFKEGWQKGNYKFDLKIEVPFAFQTELSGINDTKFHDEFWYQKDISIPSEWRDKKIIINFGAVDYRCKLFVNGELAGEHEGGHVAFSFDITNFLNFENDSIVLWVEDPSIDEMIPRGKQYWKEDSEAIWYTRTSGIWQSVWIEPISETSIEYARFTPNLDKGCVELLSEIKGFDDTTSLDVIVLFKNEVISEDTFKVKGNFVKKSINLFDNKIFRTNAHNSGWTWTPENPNLFDVKLILKKDEVIEDQVESYFGMRKVHTENGMFFLNNRPYYQKLVLDQGYWPKGLLTAPFDEDFVRDINLAKEMGFNGCRKHQKVEDPRFLYWADKLGYLVWGEMANCIEFSYKSVERITNEWSKIVLRDYNSPSIVAWVPLNESWGVPRIKFSKQEQDHSLAMYYLTHSLDTTRLVISNDGWELTKTDICGIHNYNHGNSQEKERYEHYCETLKTKENLLKSMPAGKKVYADGFSHNEDTPIMLTEFGGIAFDKNHPKGWGYSSASTEEEFVADYARTISAIYSSEAIHGYCYTQITDVEQEVNGLLTYDREKKCDLKLIKAINDMNIKEKTY